MAKRNTEGRVPPQAIAAEQAVLGAILIDGRAMDTVIEHLDGDSFYHTNHAKIFDAILSIYNREEAIDLITVAAELERRNELENIGGRSYLADLSTSVATAANVEYYCKIVLEKVNLRDLISASTDIIQKCYNEDEEVERLLDIAESTVFKIAEKRLRGAISSIGQLLPTTFEDIEQYHKRAGSITGIPLGFSEIDDMTSGLQKSDLIVIAGRPSMGKTSFALSIALNAAVGEKLPVAIFSLETSKEQLALRLLCCQAKISSHHMRTGRLSDEEWAKLSIGAGPLADAPIYVDDSSTLSVLDLRAKARRLKRKHDIRLVVVDYLQLMRGHRSAENRQQEISMISQGLKALAKELNVPVIALSQLSRKTEERPLKRPELADLRESGSIEQDADVVMMVYRPEFYGLDKFPDSGGEPAEGKAEIRLLKHRNGPTGDRKLVFLKDYARFENLETRYTEKEVPF
ncbi:MAG: replicative DNA helicase [candidate division Zixibacteria bacterium RBG_16_48_11]|nr:MAG: replicative DNA helicase [candidate division Zixibacteria bacterium RBG_16_48_11]